MEKTIRELEGIVHEYSERFDLIPDADFDSKPIRDKWSKKEVLGHLIDSAQNNLRRFICAQYENPVTMIVYQQDFWVAANQYQSMPKEDVITLWRLVNLRICAVLANMPVENHQKECNTGSMHTLGWLAADYVKHLKHHINQIVSGAFNVIYP